MKILQSGAAEKERGFVLISAVIFLIVFSILAISLMRNGILEERMVGYSRDWNMAFQAAETALRDAEREVISGNRVVGQTGFVAGCGSSTDALGLCLPNLCTNTTPGVNFDCSPIWIALDKQQNDSGWKTGSGTSKSVAYGSKTAAPAIVGVAAQPRYIIEALTVPDASSLKPPPGQPAQKYLYRVTAVGFGANVNTRVMLQGSYRQY